MCCKSDSSTEFTDYLEYYESRIEHDDTDNDNDDDASKFIYLKFFKKLRVIRSFLRVNRSFM